MVLPAGSCNWPLAPLATAFFAMAGEEISSAADNTASETCGSGYTVLKVQTVREGCSVRRGGSSQSDWLSALGSTVALFLYPPSDELLLGAPY
jgi:hypothetical protein